MMDPPATVHERVLNATASSQNKSAQDALQLPAILSHPGIAPITAVAPHLDATSEWMGASPSSPHIRSDSLGTGPPLLPADSPVHNSRSGSGGIQRPGPAAVEPPKPRSAAIVSVGRPIKEYVLTVWTGDKFGAGTDSKVCVEVIGTSGSAGRTLPGGKNIFRRGGKDMFHMKLEVRILC